jgi:hypothetical protein
MNLKKKIANETHQAAIPNTDYDRPKTTGECEIF